MHGSFQSIMNDVNQPRPRAILKILAIIGFFGILTVTAWTAILAVQYAPTAFTSLASLANRMQAGTVSQTLITTASEQTIPTSGSTKISWDSASVPGSYVFRYQCVDGVAVSVVSTEGTRGIACDSEYNLGDTQEITVQVESEKNPYQDIAYTIGFMRQNSTSIIATANGTVLVVNETLLAQNEPEETEPNEPEIESPEVPSEVTPDTEIVVAPPTTNTVTPTPTPEFIYAIPTSNPNGTIDLTVRFLNVGTITGNRFVVAPLVRNQTGALQFEVRNLGTKTSNAWTYTITGPNLTYTSPTQVALKPNEQAIISVSIPVTQERNHAFTVKINTNVDRNSNNNSFTQPITIR